jgi:hypothetical protein
MGAVLMVLLFREILFREADGTHFYCFRVNVIIRCSVESGTQQSKCQISDLKFSDMRPGDVPVGRLNIGALHFMGDRHFSYFQSCR